MLRKSIFRVFVGKESMLLEGKKTTIDFLVRSCNVMLWGEVGSPFILCPNKAQQVSKWQMEQRLTLFQCSDHICNMAEIPWNKLSRQCWRRMIELRAGSCITSCRIGSEIWDEKKLWGNRLSMFYTSYWGASNRSYALLARIWKSRPYVYLLFYLNVTTELTCEGAENAC